MERSVFMPDNLRITAPVTTSEGVGKTNPLKEPTTVDAVNPERVAQPNTQEQNVDSQSLDLLLNLESVYGKFIQQLRRTPALSRSLGETLGNAAAAREQLLARQPESSPLRRLVDGLPMTREEILENLQFQQENSSEFSGPFFQFLSLLSAKSGDAGFDLQLAGFLKAYDAFRNAGSTTKSILRDLKSIGEQIPKDYGAELGKLAEKVGGERPGDSAPANLQVLKKEILPLLCRYVSRSNDYGKSRENISLLLHHITMLEAGVKENVADSFRKLIDYAKFGLNLPEDTVNSVQALFAGELAKTRRKPQNGFLDSLVSLLTQQGQQTDETRSGSGQSVYRDVCNALLLDNSVYMPFTHLFLPLVYDGRFLFAQIWVEKNGGDDGDAAQASAPGRPLRVYLSFEIQDLGHFEATVALAGNKAELAVGYPPALDGRRGEIREQLSSIFERNGLVLGKAELSPCGEPKMERDILKKIEERRHSVNVTV